MGICTRLTTWSDTSTWPQPTLVGATQKCLPPLGSGKFDVDVFLSRVSSLNGMINADKATVLREGRKAKLGYRDRVNVGVWEDGISVGVGGDR